MFYDCDVCAECARLVWFRWLCLGRHSEKSERFHARRDIGADSYRNQQADGAGLRFPKQREGGQEQEVLARREGRNGEGRAGLVAEGQSLRLRAGGEPGGHHRAEGARADAGGNHRPGGGREGESHSGRVGDCLRNAAGSGDGY